MAKDPAFLFYPNDYIGGTMGMTFEEKGAYIELLMTQFNRGHMSGQVVGQVVGQLWGKIKDKFKVDDKGMYFNERLDIEIEKRKAFVQSRLNNISGKNQYTKKGGHSEGHTGTRMEDENRIVIDYGFIVENYHSLCPKMNKVVVINDLRKGFMNARVSEFGLDKVITVIRIAGESDFLNGKNDKAWKADFEWILRPTNFVKIMEGKYNKSEIGTGKTYTHAEMLEITKDNPDIWKQYKAIKRDGERKAIFELIK
jgi:uncharacterized protein YdaU (DUF1376 family)